MTIIQDIVGNTMTDHTTAGVAAGAIASPVWLPLLQDASNVAAVVAPLLGAVWLVVQIAGKLVDIRAKIKDKANEDRQ